MEVASKKTWTDCVPTWLRRSLAWLFLTDPLLLSDVTKTDAYRMAKEQCDAMQPTAAADYYNWVFDLGVKSYEWTEDKIKRLDEKADSIIKHLGGGTAIVSLAGFASGRVDLLIMLLPAFVCSLAAVRHAVRVRAPFLAANPAPLQTAFNRVQEHGCTGKARYLGRLHLLYQASLLCSMEKAKALATATRLYYATLLCLAIPFACLIIQAAKSWISSVLPAA